MPNTHAFLLWAGTAALAQPGAFNPVNGSSQWLNATENWYQTPLGKAVTFTNMALYWTVTLAFSGSMTFRVNGANGNQAIPASVSAGVYSDTTHSDAAAAGALVNYFSNGLQLYNPYWQQAPHSRSSPYTSIGASPSGHTSGGGFANGSYFTNMVGDCNSGQASSSVTNLQEVQQAGTAASYSMNVQSAPSGTVTTNFQVNSSLGNQQLVFTGITGVVEDTTHTDAIAANSQLNQKISATASSGTFQHAAFDFNGNKSTLPYVASLNPRTGGGPTAYIAPGGAIQINVSSIAQANVPVVVGFTASQLLFSCDSAQMISNEFIQLYNNSSAGNMKVPYPSGTTGFYNDATHTDAITAGNPFCNQYSGGGFDVSMIGFGLDDLSNTGSHPSSFAAIQG